MKRKITLTIVLILAMICINFNAVIAANECTHQNLKEEKINADCMHNTKINTICKDCGRTIAQREEEKTKDGYKHYSDAKKQQKVIYTEIKEDDGTINVYKITTYLCDPSKGGCGAIYTKEKIVNDVNVGDDAEFSNEEKVWNIDWNGYPLNGEWKHVDKWNDNKLEFLCQRYSSKDFDPTPNEAKTAITLTDTSNLLLCKQKGGSLRFTPSFDHLNNAEVSGPLHPKMSDLTQISAKVSAKSLAESLVPLADYYKPSTIVYSQIFQFYKGFSYPKPQREGDWSGLIYYGKAYCTTPHYNRTEANETEKNNRIAYIMSSGAEFAPTSSYIGFSKGNYQGSKSDIADDQLIQDALWMARENDNGDPYFNEGNKYSNEDAKQLHKEAKQYETFYETYLEGDKKYRDSVIVTNDLAQVIVEKRKDYILGPFKIEYPDKNPFSYIESMYIEAEGCSDGRTHILSEGKFEIIDSDNNREYPGDGKNFYVKFNAEEAFYPTSVNIKVKFAYLASCSAKYDIYEGKGEVRQIQGKLEKMDTDEVAYTEDIKETTDENGNGELDIISTNTYYYYKWYFTTTDEKIGDYKVQKLAMLKQRNRKWTNYEKSITGGYMDLTMELGGMVWEDNVPEGNKETQGDNKYASGTNDKKMPNVIVTLYKSDGTLAVLTKDNDKTNDSKEQIQNPTKTDANGEYKFTGLNSMYQYYVEFTYNAQYYQPVEYVSPKDETNGFGKGNWKENSNGTDVRSKREEINARFASIGSSPANYKVGNRTNKTYSKDQLLGKTLDDHGNLLQTGYAVIDQFGNLLYNNKNKPIVKNPNGQEIEVTQLKGAELTDINSKIQYVKDCQLNSYTGKDEYKNNKYERTTKSNDLYPTYKTFVIDKTVKGPMESILGYDKETFNKLYKDNNHLRINQGYVARQEAHIIVQKEVQKVVLEINGQEHTYNYDQIYKNKSNKNSDDYDNYWTVPERLQKGYYYMNGSKIERYYTREIYESDYLYKVDMYGTAKDALDKKTSDELEVYVTYRIMINNSSQSIRTRIDELVDYYDTDYEFIPDRSYMKIEKGTDVYKYGLNSALDNSTMYTAQGTRTGIDGYRNLYISKIGNNANLIDGDRSKLEANNEEGMYLYSGETANVFLTFKVRKDAQRNVLIDEYNNKDLNNTKIGKGNVVELNGYSTIYANGTNVANVGDVSGKPAGIVDKASNPGNLEASTVINKDYKKFEDDTDKAPAIKIKVVSALSREISGTVWEDERTLKDAQQQGAIVGDGLKDNKFINGVTVQLVEITSNGQEFVWREFGDISIIKDENGKYKYTYGRTGEGSGSGLNTTVTPIINDTINQDTNEIIEGETEDKSIVQYSGQYIFTGFMPGKYIVRFIYGDREETIVPNDTYNNKTSYNGQDYKSTTYQKGVDQNSLYEWNRWKWDSKTEEFVKDGNTITTISGFIVNNPEKNYSNNETAITAFTNDNKAYLYDIAKSQDKNVSDAKDIESRRNAVNDYSDNNIRNHIAEVLAVPDSNNLNLLQELIDNTKMTAETGLIVMEFEYNTKTTDNQDDENSLTYVVSDVDLGLEERPQAQLAIDKEVTNMKLTLADGSTLFDARQTATNVAWKEHVEYKTGYENNYRMKEIDAQMLLKERLGLIQVSMDEELMHGAKIRITYNIKVRNVGEIDYKENKFYYTGVVENTENVVKTSADKVIDYVANNLQFDKEENEEWTVIKELTSNTDNDLVNYRLKDKVEQFNTIIITDKLNTPLVPKLFSDKIKNDSVSDVSVPLVLSQLITSENDTDDLTYENLVEIVETSNTVGRRMAYSVVGNQDPTAKQPSEVDSDIAESVKILPPFGNSGLYIIIATTIMIAIAILTGGIIFIKKKVLK